MPPDPALSAESVRPELRWAERIRQFFDTWNYDLISQDDVDRLHAHLSMTLRLRALTDGGDGA